MKKFIIFTFNNYLPKFPLCSIDLWIEVRIRKENWNISSGKFNTCELKIQRRVKAETQFQTFKIPDKNNKWLKRKIWWHNEFNSFRKVCEMVESVLLLKRVWELILTSFNIIEDHHMSWIILLLLPYLF